MRGYTKIKRVFNHWYVAFATTFIVATIAIWIILETPLRRVLLGYELGLSAFLLDRIGFKSISIDYNILLVYGGKYVVTVIFTPECSAMFATIVFVLTAILIPNIGVRRKLDAILVYAPLIFTINVLRVLLLLVIGLLYGIYSLKLFHDYGSTLFFIVTYSILWVDWLYRSLSPSVGKILRIVDEKVSPSGRE